MLVIIMMMTMLTDNDNFVFGIIVGIRRKGLLRF